MIRLFKHYVPHAVLFLGIVDFALLVLAGELGWQLRAHQVRIDPGSITSRSAIGSPRWRRCVGAGFAVKRPP